MGSHSSERNIAVLLTLLALFGVAMPQGKPISRAESAHFHLLRNLDFGHRAVAMIRSFDETVF